MNNPNKPSDIFTIEKGDPAIAFFFMYGIALQHYVAARVNLLSGLVEPGCLLAHQSIEVFIKAITRLEPEAEQPWGHDLNKLLIEANGIFPKFNELMADEQVAVFLDNLHNVYKWKRYGEAKSNINGLETAKILDELIHKLRIIYAETIKGHVSKLYVPENLVVIFTKENTRFSEAGITSNILASLGMPGAPDIDFNLSEEH